MKDPAASYRPEMRSSSWLALIQIARIFSGLLVGIIVIRYLGTDEYGALALALSLSGFFNAFGTLGLPRVFLQELVLPSIEPRTLLGSALVLQMASGIIGLIGTWVLCAMLDQPSHITVMAVVCALAFLANGGVLFQQLFLSRHKVNLSAAANITGLSLSLLYRISAVLLKAPVAWFAAANVIQSVIVLLASFGLALPIVRELTGRLRPRFKPIQRLLIGASPLFLASLLQSIPLYSDRVLIGTYLTIKDVGIYAVLLQLVTIPSMLISSFIGGASPRLLPKLERLNDADNDKEVMFTLSVATGATAAMLVSMTLIAPVLMPTVYGSDFRVSPWMFAIMGIGVVANVPNTLRYEFLLSQNRQNLAMVISGLHAISTLVLQLFFILQLGLIGAAIAYAIQKVIFAALLSHLFPTLAPYRRVYWHSLFHGLTFLPLLKYVVSLMAEKKMSN